MDEFDLVSASAKELISLLLRREPRKRLSASRCLEHDWLVEKLMRKKTMRIPMSNLKKYLARRKVQNVKCALRVINAMKGAVRERFVHIICHSKPMIIYIGW